MTSNGNLRNAGNKSIQYLLLIIALLILFSGCARKYPPAVSDQELPAIASVYPIGGAVDVPVTTSIIITFSEEMSLPSINDANFQIEPEITGKLSFDGISALFVPDSGLMYDTVYTFTVYNQVMDNSGNPMESDFSWSFRTALPPGVNYNGYVKIYMVEPVSRELMYNKEPYHYGFLGFAYDTAVNLEFEESLERTISWTGYNITENNIMAIAVVFGNEAHLAYSWPPDRYPFNAYYTDACAAADKDSSWPNQAAGTFTHTAFIEEGTRTSCYNCPNTAEALELLFESGEYSFFYTALIRDKNVEASCRLLNALNHAGDPTCYFDGGHEVLIGGYDIDSLALYRNRLISAGEREVAKLDLSLELTWVGENTVNLNLVLTNRNRLQTK